MIPMYEQIARALLSGQPVRLPTTRAYVNRLWRDIAHVRAWLRCNPTYDPFTDPDVAVVFDDGLDRCRVVSRTYAITIFRLVMEHDWPAPTIIRFPAMG